MFEIVFIHLLNDFSGSPKVLKETIRAVTSRQGQGNYILEALARAFFHTAKSQLPGTGIGVSGLKILTLFSYLLSQYILFVMLLCDRSIAKDAVIYVNTLLPSALPSTAG